MKSLSKFLRPLGSVLLLWCSSSLAQAVEPIPDKLVVLTFDDSVANHATYVAPLLKKYGFRATFFITEGFEFLTDKEHYLTWEQITSLHADGFEIGNHTRSHKGVASIADPNQLREEVEFLEQRCVAHGIPRPTTFCYPGYGTSVFAVRLLRERAYRFARSGGSRVYDPGKDDPLTLPQAFDGKPASTLEQFQSAVEGAKDGKIAILTFHGVPDIRHPWVSTDREKFESYMEHLKSAGCRVIALGDLAKYIPEAPAPALKSP